MRALVHDVEHLTEELAHGLVLRPARQLLGAPIQVVDATGNIGGDNGIPYGRQSDLDPFLLVEKGILGTLAFRPRGIMGKAA